MLSSVYAQKLKYLLEICQKIPTVVNFVADKKTCTEVFQMLFEKTKADIQKDYTAILLADGINLVEKGTVIEEYIARDTYDVIRSSQF